MVDENFARLRTHRSNIQRYRQLLETSLTDLEREFIAKRLAEEQSVIETLAATMLMLNDPASSGYARSPNLTSSSNGRPTREFQN